MASDAVEDTMLVYENSIVKNDNDDSDIDTEDDDDLQMEDIDEQNMEEE